MKVFDLARLVRIDSLQCGILKEKDDLKGADPPMLMKKKKKKSASPSLGILAILPLAVLGAYVLMKKKGQAVLRNTKCCCTAAEKAIDQMTN